MTSTNDNMPPRRPEENESAHDVLDFIDETVARITDADVDKRLREVLDQGGRRPRTDSERQAAGLGVTFSDNDPATVSAENFACHEADALITAAEMQARLEWQVREAIRSAREQVDQIVADACEEADKALTQAAKIVRDARDQAERIVSDARQTARDEAERIVSDARQIARDEAKILSLILLGPREPKRPNRHQDRVLAYSESAPVPDAVRPAEPAAWDADRVVTEIYHGEYKSLVRLAVLLVHDVPTAEEVVQDAFEAMHTAWRRLSDSDKALSYLRQAVVNRSRSVLRHRMVVEKNAPKPAPDEPSAEHGALALIERSAIVAALRTLPARQREAIMLRYYADLSEADIAATMGISRGAVKSHTARAMSALRSILEQEESSSPPPGRPTELTAGSASPDDAPAAASRPVEAEAEQLR